MGPLKTAPRWIWAIIAGLSLIEPITHLWLMYSPPAGTTHTGIHIADSVIFIHAMRMFETDFWAPYVTCNAGDLGHSPSYFPVPFLWLYGGVGAVGRFLGIDEFIMLGLINGLGAALYLSAVYVFFRTVFANIANRAFLLFTLGGGLAGVAYVVSFAFGFTSSPEFEGQFFRFALYELLEGPRLAPWLVFPRLYYTLPLALGYAAFTLLHQGLEQKKTAPIVWATLFIFVAAFINIRLGPFIWVIALLLLWCEERRDVKMRVRTAIALTAGVGLAAAMTVTMLQWNPVYADNAFSLIRRGMWLSPFVIAAFFHLLLAPNAIRRTFDTLPNPAYMAGCGAVGYAIAYVGLYCAYQAYYGSYWPPADFSASVRISDPALIGALLGFVYARMNMKFRDPILDEDTIPMHWITLWFLLFVTVAPSAFGQGLFLRLGPQRMMLFMGPPLCLLSARALDRLELQSPRVYLAGMTTMLTCGGISIAVAVLCFQGPLGFDPKTSAFREYHGEVVTVADGQLLDSLGEGMVLAPTTLPLFGDFATIRGNSALYGLGAWDLSDLTAVEASEITDAFFAEESSEELRLDTVMSYCAGWVYCPTTPPVPEGVLGAFRSYDWLVEVDSIDGGAVFKVQL